MNRSKEGLRELLMQLDRDFDDMTSKSGVDGWVSYFAEDGVVVTSKSDIKGKEAIRSEMSKVFSLKDFSLRWEPIDAQVSDGGDLGFTYGKYKRSYIDSEGKLISSTGKYTSIWKKQVDGSWKIILDIGT